MDNEDHNIKIVARLGTTSISTYEKNKVTVDTNIIPIPLQPEWLQCRCGSTNQFAIAASLTVRQTQIKDRIETSFKSDNIYVMPNTVVVCQKCFHVGPYFEFHKRGIADQEDKEILVDEIMETLGRGKKSTD